MTLHLADHVAHLVVNLGDLAIDLLDHIVSHIGRDPLVELGGVGDVVASHDAGADRDVEDRLGGVVVLGGCGFEHVLDHHVSGVGRLALVIL